MIDITYIGGRKAKEDNVAGTGLVWADGETLAVPDVQAAMLLAHPSVWVKAAPKPVSAKKPADAGPSLPAKTEADALAEAAAKEAKDKADELEAQRLRDEDNRAKENSLTFPNVMVLKQSELADLASRRYNETSLKT